MKKDKKLDKTIQGLVNSLGGPKKKTKFKTGLGVGADKYGFAIEKQIDSDTGIRMIYSRELDELFVSIYEYKEVGTLWDPIGWVKKESMTIGLKYINELLPMIEKISKLKAFK